MKNILILLALISFLAFGCNKDKDAPMLFLDSPSEGATISGPVNITGKVTDKELHEMTLTITKESDGTVLYNKVIQDVHELSSYNFNEVFTPTNILMDTKVILNIEVEDHIPNITTKNIRFTLKP